MLIFMLFLCLVILGLLVSLITFGIKEVLRLRASIFRIDLETAFFLILLPSFGVLLVLWIMLRIGINAGVINV